jgi:hypothetical protein
MNEFSVNFERLILGTFAKGSEHLKINSLYFYEYIVFLRICMASVVKYIFM